MAYRERQTIFTFRKISEYFSYLIIFLTAVYLTLPPSDSNFNSDFGMTHVKNAISTFSLPFLPFQNPPIWLRIFTVFAFLVLWLCLSTQGRVFVSPTIIILLINSVFGYDFYWWHKGTFLLIVLFAIYLTHKERNERGLGLTLKSLTVAIIFAQLLGTVFGIGTDFRNSIPYSNAKSASSFVQELCSKSCTLVSDNSV